MAKEFHVSFEIIISGISGAVLGAWTTELFNGFSWTGFWWVIGGSAVLFLVIALILKGITKDK